LPERGLLHLLPLLRFTAYYSSKVESFPQA
jgi:hypothetical protein